METEYIKKMAEKRDREASQYEKWYKSNHPQKEYDEEVKSIIEAVNPQPNDLILDVGAGTGQFSEIIAAKCRHLVALDNSQKSIEEIDLHNSSKGNITAHVHDITHPIPRIAAFDKAFSTQVIQHIPSHELRIAALRNIRDALKQGGELVCEMFDYNSKKWIMRRIKDFKPFKKEEVLEDYYCHYFTADEFLKLLKEAGFSENYIIYKKNGFFISRSVK